MSMNMCILASAPFVLFLLGLSIPAERGRKFDPRPYKANGLWREEADLYGADFDRVQVWDAFSDSFLDTSFDAAQLEWLATIIANSPFSIAELAHILLYEVSPVCMMNRFMVLGGEGMGFDPDFIIPRCLANQNRKPFHSEGKDNKIPLIAHLLGTGCEGYYFLIAAARIRESPDGIIAKSA